MDEVESSKKEAIETLRSIQTLEDLKEKREDLLDAQEKVLKTAVGTINDFFDSAMNLTDEEKAEKVNRFSDETYIMDPEMDAEMNRIYDLPGAEEYLKELDEEMEERVGPYFQEFMDIMQNKMFSFMGEMMGAVGEAMSAASSDEVIEQIEIPQPSKEAYEYINMLTTFLTIVKLEELKEYREDMIARVDEVFGEEIDDYNIIVEMKLPKEEVDEKIAKLKKMEEVARREMEKVFARVEERSGDTEFVNSVREEYNAKLDHYSERIEKLGSK